MQTERPPGPGLTDLPALVPAVIGDDPLAAADRLKARYGDVVRIPYHPGIGGGGYLVSHPDDIQSVLQTDQSLYRVHRTRARRDLEAVLGRGLVTSGGDHWLRQTRLLTPRLFRDRVGAFCELIVAEARRTVADLEDRATAGDAVAVLPMAKRLTLRIIGRALFSTDLAAYEPRIPAALSTLRASFKRRNSALLRPPLWAPTPTSSRVRAARDVVRGVAMALIRERRRATDPSEDLLTFMLTATDDVTGEAMSTTQVRDEVVSFLVAGHETVSAALAWSWYLLATHPDVHRRLHESSNAVDLVDPSLETVRELTAATHVVEEALRLYPPVPFLGREARQPVTLGGYRLPEGATIVIAPHLPQRDARFWRDPGQFDPDRFGPDRAVDRHEFAYVPFSAGGHACTGREFAMVELPLVLATVVSAVRLTFPDDPPPVHPDFGVNLEPDTALEMQVRSWG